MDSEYSWVRQLRGGCMYGKCFYVLSIFDTEHVLIRLPSQKGIYFCWTLTQKFFLRQTQNPRAIKWKNRQWTTQPHLNFRLLGGKRRHKKKNWSRGDQRREENVKLITDKSQCSQFSSSYRRTIHSPPEERASDKSKERLYKIDTHTRMYENTYFLTSKQGNGW